MRIFLVRHGQSKGNVDKSQYFKYPDSEISLTEKGEEDAKSAALTIGGILDSFRAQLPYPPEDNYRFKMFHSTYKRATETADIIFDTLNNSSNKFKVDYKIPTPLCIEREWGSLRDIVNSRLKTDEHFNFYYRPVGGESFCDTYKRAAIFHQWLLNNTTYDNNIVVAHGEFNKVYLMHLLNWDVNEFNKWANPKNGEVWLIENGELSAITPLRHNKYVR